MNFDARKYVIIVFIITVGFIYIVRLFFMQVIDDSWTLRAQEIAEKRKQIVPPRGAVFDRKGVKVVSNRTYYNLMFIEDDIKHSGGLIHNIGMYFSGCKCLKERRKYGKSKSTKVAKINLFLCC
jgi:penicillin-binding protein 2